MVGEVNELPTGRRNGVLLGAVAISGVLAVGAFVDVFLVVDDRYSTRAADAPWMFLAAAVLAAGATVLAADRRVRPGVTEVTALVAVAAWIGGRLMEDAESISSTVMFAIRSAVVTLFLAAWILARRRSLYTLIAAALGGVAGAAALLAGEALTADLGDGWPRVLILHALPMSVVAGLVGSPCSSTRLWPRPARRGIFIGPWGNRSVG